MHPGHRGERDRVRMKKKVEKINIFTKSSFRTGAKRAAVLQLRKSYICNNLDLCMYQ